MTQVNKEIEIWIEMSLNKLKQGQLQPFDFEVLRALITSRTAVGQELLYLFTRESFPSSEVVAWSDPRNPDPASNDDERPYSTVTEALEDGWRIVQFPEQSFPPDSSGPGLVGSEFILERARTKE